MFLVDTIIASVNNVVDKIFPDATVAAQVKAQIAAQSVDWYKMEMQDRDSARQREIATQDKTVRQLAWVYTGGYFALLGAILSGYAVIPPNLTSVLDVLLGVLTAGQYSVLSYYFGSSSGSADKTKLMSKE